MDNVTKYSIVIPVYNSEKIVEKTVSRIFDVAKQNSLFMDVILVNDGSLDKSWDVVKYLAENNKKITAINLVKNYGQHNAVLCGFKYAKGDYVITMDDDLQNPPKELVKLIQKAQEDDYDLVFGKFRQKKHSFYRKLGTKVIGFLNNKIFSKPRGITLTNFRIIKQDVIQRALKHKTSYPYVPGLLLLYSTSIANTLVEHEPREIGKSNYTTRKMLSLTSRLLINYSSYPLRLLSAVGFIVAFLSFMYGLTEIFSKVFLGVNVPGWTTLVVLVSFLGGFIIMLLGLIGEYLSRVLDQISVSESYFIKEIVE